MIFPEESGGFVCRCVVHGGWVFRTPALTDADLARMRTSLKRHITKNLSITVEYRGCLPGGAA